MYENEIKNTSVCVSEANTNFAFNELQTKKRALAEDCLIKSERILAYLVNHRPIVDNEKQDIDCFMTDLLSEKETLQKLNDNLSFILDCLGA